MNRKAAIALFLLLIPTATAITPWIAAVAGLSLIGALLGVIVWQHEQIANLQEYTEFIYGLYNSSTSIAQSTLNYSVNQDKLEYQMITNIHNDFVSKGKAWAWTIAKYQALKVLDEELRNGTDFTLALSKAKSAAQEALWNYYNNLSRNELAIYNAKILRLQLSAIAACQVGYNIAQGASTPGDYTVLVLEEVEIGGKRTNTGDIMYNVKVCGDGGCTSYSPGSSEECAVLENRTYYASNLSVSYNYYILEVDGVGVYYSNGYVDELIATLKEIDNQYALMTSNLDAYLNGLTSTIFSSYNVSDLLDPITVATQINNDWETTGYYGFAAAELAMLGLNLAGLNKTVTIDVNGTILRGILFTDWSGVLELNKTYTADQGYLWYFIDENGQMYDLKGYNFTVVDLRDKDGNQLNSTTFERYVDHSGDIQKIYEELAKLNELYQQYLEMQTVTGGGSVGDWWANLTDTQKMLVIGAVVLFIVLLARK